MKTTSVLLAATGIAIGAAAVDEVYTEPKIDKIIKRIDTIVTVTHSDNILERRGQYECRKALSTFTEVALATNTPEFPDSIRSDMVSYARSYSNPLAVLQGCGEITTQGALSTAYASWSSARDEFASSIAPLFQKAKHECRNEKDIDMLDAWPEMAFGECPAWFDAVTAPYSGAAGKVGAGTGVIAAAGIVGVVGLVLGGL